MSSKIQSQEQNALLTQPAMIDDEDLSPAKLPTPKKPKTSNPGLLSYFTKKVTNIFSPSRSNSLASSSQDNAAGHDSPALTPSCLEKGDESVERFFKDSLSKRSCDDTLSFDLDYSHEGGDITTSTGASLSIKNSSCKRKSEEITLNKRNMTRLSQARDPNMSWTEMEIQMKGDGLWHMAGTGLESYWWVLPTFQGFGKNELMKQCKEGEDYFRTEESLRLYAKETLGWGGVVAQEEKRRRKGPLRVKSPPKRAAPNAAKSPSKKARTSNGPKIDKTVASPQNCPTSSDSHDENESVCMPDLETVLKDKLQATQMVLHPGFDGNYCSVSAKASKIMEFMATCVVEGQESAPSPGFLYVCGRPGTGKVRNLIILLTYFLCSYLINIYFI